MAMTAALSGFYDYRLVALSIFLSLLAAYAALDLAGRVASADGARRILWLSGGATAMGTGIWSMHYVGMEAFHLPIPVKYDWPTVLLSLLAAIGASAVALVIVSGRTMGRLRTVLGSIVMGSGIAAMHYIGMAAMRLEAMCIYSSSLVALSVLLAIACSSVALRLTFAARGRTASWDLKKLASAVVMGLAIPVMHYVGMAAVHFVPVPSMNGSLANAVSVSSLGVAGIAFVTVMLLIPVYVSSAMDRQLSRQARFFAEDRLQLETIFDAMAEAIVVVDCERRIAEHNRASCELFGLRDPILSMQQMDDKFEAFSAAGVPILHEDWPLVRAFHGDFCRVVEVIIRRKDTGASVTVEISTAPVPAEDGHWRKIIASFRDITQRKLAETARKESELLYHNLFDSMEEGFCIIEMIFDEELKPVDYIFIEVNRAFEKQTGLLGAAGKRMREFAPSHEAYWFELYGKVVLTGEPAHIVSEAKALDGFFEIHAYRIGEPARRRVAIVFNEISERMRAEAALREQAALLDLAHDAIMVCDLDGKIRFWNHGAENIYGYSSGEATGRVSHQLLSTVFPQPLAEIEELVLRNGRWSGELTHTTRDGTLVEVNSRWVAQQDNNGNVIGVLEINNDISERKRMDEARNRLVAIVESSDDAIVGKNAEGIITSWNPGAERIFGYTSAEMIGRSLKNLLTPDREHEEDEILRRIKLGETVEHIESVRRRKDGKLIQVSLTISPIKDASGRVVGASKIARDITQRKQMELQLHQSQKMEAIGQLTGGIAHDFNNLLGIILGNLDLLEEHVSGHDVALDQVQTSQRAAMRGADLTRRLLAFAKMEALNPASASLHSAVENMIAMATRALGPEIKITTQFDDSVPHVFVDLPGLENALLNLVLNARDAMPKGGAISISTHLVNLEEAYSPVQAGDLKAGWYACVSISDTGQGMSQETQERAFEPFFTTKPRGKGTGLGLAMVYSFAKHSGGIVRIYSELGKGTSVSMYLPLAETGLEGKSDAKEYSSVPLNGTVLVVDDEVDLLKIASAYLAEMGLAALQAVDGPSALEIVRQKQIDLMVTDIVMPGGMSGLELAQRVHELKPEIKLIYSSGFPADALAERSMSLVNDPLLHKPYQRSEFRAIVRSVLEGRGDVP